MHRKLLSSVLALGMLCGVAELVTLPTIGTSCLTAAQKTELEQSKANVAMLQSALAASRSSGASTDVLARAQADLNEANRQLSALKSSQTVDRVSRGAEVGQNVLANIAPLIGFAFPGAGGLLGLIGAALGGLKSAQPYVPPPQPTPPKPA